MSWRASRGFAIGAIASRELDGLVWQKGQSAASMTRHLPCGRNRRRAPRRAMPPRDAQSPRSPSSRLARPSTRAPSRAWGPCLARATGAFGDASRLAEAPRAPPRASNRGRCRHLPGCRRAPAPLATKPTPFWHGFPTQVSQPRLISSRKAAPSHTRPRSVPRAPRAARRIPESQTQRFARAPRRFLPPMSQRLASQKMGASRRREV